MKTRLMAVLVGCVLAAAGCKKSTIASSDGVPTLTLAQSSGPGS